MAKQLMIYDNIQPLSSDAHRNWSVAVESYQFASNLISVPLVSSEIITAAQEFPIVFSKSGNDFIPLAIMGLREGENLLINEEGRMTTRYTPAFLRRYPFMVGAGKDDNKLVGVDVDSSAIVQDGSRGQRLFTEDGEQTPFLKEVIEFVKDYQYRTDIANVFCRRLMDLELLEPMTANVNVGGKEGANISLSGFYVVNREKLKALSNENVLDLFKKDGLELIYAHLASLNNMSALTQKVAEKIRS
ncbi:MAG: SapC family protein [Cellvibrio sp.]|nr:SapC family protein [Cellvibrio sp.]